MNQIQYEFSILRYTHDLVGGERINVAVMLMSSSSVKILIDDSRRRFESFYPGAKWSHVRDKLKSIESACQKLIGESSISDLACLIARIIPEDDAALAPSEVGMGIANDIASVEKSLKKQFLSKWNQPQNEHSDCVPGSWLVCHASIRSEAIGTRVGASPQSDLVEFESRSLGAWKVKGRSSELKYRAGLNSANDDAPTWQDANLAMA